MAFGRKNCLIPIRFSINLFSCVKAEFAAMNLAWIVKSMLTDCFGTTYHKN